MDEMDLLDRKILFELDLNARIPASELAKTLRRSKETINFRIRRLIARGFIRGFYTVFNTSLLGWYYFKVYLKFKDTTPEKEDEIFEYIRTQPRISYLASIEGYYDCIFLVMVRNSLEMADVLGLFMKKFGDFIQEKEMVTFLTTHRLNQRFLFRGGETKDWHYPVEMGSYHLDGIDSRILDAISNNARMPVVDIARKAGADHKVVRYRLKRLERDRVILAYVTSISFESLNSLFAQVNLSLKDPTVRKNVIGYFDSTDKCLFAIELLGRYDLTIELHVDSNEELRRIMDGFKKMFVGKYGNYDISVIDREYLIVWGPFSEKSSQDKNPGNKEGSKVLV